MDINMVKSEGFAKDIEVANNFGIVVLHCWSDGAILIMECDEAIPTQDDRLSATGYVFLNAQPDEKGPLVFEGTRYSTLEIEDFVLWDNTAAVEKKYHMMLELARKAED